MGLIGLGVAFGATDRVDGTGPINAPDPDARTPHAIAQDALGVVVDDVIEADMVLGIAFARRLSAIDLARLAFEAAEASSGVSTPSSRDMARRGFVAEVAAALRMADRTADKLIETARVLNHELPATLLALREGRLNQRHAQILVDNVVGLDTTARGELESRMLPLAEKNTPSRFERSVRRSRERLNPETMVARQVAASEDRAIGVVPGRDGVGVLEISGPIVQLVAIENRITDIARACQNENEPRTLTQLKFDVLCDLLLDIDGVEIGETTTAGRGNQPIDRFRSIRPKVLITVPVLTLFGRSDEPGELEGYGPIDAQSAREIASLAPSWQRLFTDPATGIVLRMGREKYRPPDDLRLWLRVRDGTCRFPGCNRTAMRCDLDHTKDWDAKHGPSDHDNLAHLCRRHHTLKHHTDWKVEQLPGGILRWTSPSGIRYETDPELQLAG